MQLLALHDCLRTALVRIMLCLNTGGRRLTPRDRMTRGLPRVPTPVAPRLLGREHPGAGLRRVGRANCRLEDPSPVVLYFTPDNEMVDESLVMQINETHHVATSHGPLFLSVKED